MSGGQAAGLGGRLKPMGTKRLLARHSFQEGYNQLNNHIIELWESPLMDAEPIKGFNPV